MSLKTRLARLEQHCAPESVLGVQIGDGPVEVRGEEMTPEAFRERYPAGHLIHAVTVNPERCPKPANN